MNLQDSHARIKRGIIVSQDLFAGSILEEDINSYLETYGQYVISRVARKLKRTARIRTLLYFAKSSGNHAIFFITSYRIGCYDFEIILARYEFPMGQMARTETDFNSRTRKLISLTYHRYIALHDKREGRNLVSVSLPAC